MAKIVLASGSPRRQELLQRIGITDFDIRVPQTEETYPAGLSPRQTVEYISREKSDAAAALCTPEEIIITADTMVFLDDQRLGKPVDEADALPRRRSSGATSAPASPWTRPGPTASRGWVPFWWSGWTVTFST